MLSWFISRHVFYLKVIYSIYKDLPRGITNGCYSGGMHNLTGPFEAPDDYYHLMTPFIDPEGVVCWSDNITWAFIYALLALQALLLIWFGMIVRVVVKVLRGGDAIDSRSDDEGEEGDEEDEAETTVYEKQGEVDAIEHAIAPPPLEEEVGVESINLGSQRNSPARKFRKGGGAASGVTLHSDRKELLGRIGCDKGA